MPEASGQVLGHPGAMVDVHGLQEAKDHGPYRAVVIGSATRAEKNWCRACLP